MRQTGLTMGLSLEGLEVCSEAEREKEGNEEAA